MIVNLLPLVIVIVGIPCVPPALVHVNTTWSFVATAVVETSTVPPTNTAPVPHIAFVPLLNVMAFPKLAKAIPPLNVELLDESKSKAVVPPPCGLIEKPPLPYCNIVLLSENLGHKKSSVAAELFLLCHFTEFCVIKKVFDEILLDIIPEAAKAPQVKLFVPHDIVPDEVNEVQLKGPHVILFVPALIVPELFTEDEDKAPVVILPEVIPFVPVDIGTYVCIEVEVDVSVFVPAEVIEIP